MLPLSEGSRGLLGKKGGRHGIRAFEGKVGFSDGRKSNRRGESRWAFQSEGGLRTGHRGCRGRGRRRLRKATCSEIPTFRWLRRRRRANSDGDVKARAVSAEAPGKGGRQVDGSSTTPASSLCRQSPSRRRARSWSVRGPKQRDGHDIVFAQAALPRCARSREPIVEQSAARPGHKGARSGGRRRTTRRPQGGPVSRLDALVGPRVGGRNGSGFNASRRDPSDNGRTSDSRDIHLRRCLAPFKEGLSWKASAARAAMGAARRSRLGWWPSRQPEHGTW